MCLVGSWREGKEEHLRINAFMALKNGFQDGQEVFQLLRLENCYNSSLIILITFFSVILYLEVLTEILLTGVRGNVENACNVQTSVCFCLV